MKKDLFNTRSEIAAKYIPVTKQELRNKMEDGGGVEKSKEPKKLLSTDLSPEEMKMASTGYVGLAMIAAKRKMAQKQYKKEQVENYKAKHGGKEEWEVEAAKWKYKKGGSIKSSLGAEYFVGDSCLITLGRGNRYRKVKIQNITDKWVYYSYEAGTKKTYLSVRDFENKVSGKSNESDEVEESGEVDKTLVKSPKIIVGKLEVFANDFPEKMKLKDAMDLKNFSDGWRLPTKEELDLMYQNKDNIGGFSSDTSDFYLSSTEIPLLPDLIYIQNFGVNRKGGTQGHINNKFKVRAVRDIVAPEVEEGQVRLVRGKPVKNMAARKSPKIIIGNLEVYANELPEIMNWDDAVKACNNLGEGWRLPTKGELNKVFEENKISGKFVKHIYWSSTENGDYAWEQYFGSGNQYQSPKKGVEHKVLPVRDIVAPKGPKPIIANLEVYANDFPEKMNWDDAAKACNNLGEGWRLPTKEELNKLFKEKDNIGGFESEFYWSSTSFATTHALKASPSLKVSLLDNFHSAQYFGDTEFTASDDNEQKFKVRAVRDIVAPEIKEVTKSTENIAEPKNEIAKDTQKSFLGWVYQNMASSTELDNAMLAKKILSDFGANMKSTGNNNADMVLKIINEIPVSIRSVEKQSNINENKQNGNNKSLLKKTPQISATSFDTTTIGLESTDNKTWDAKFNLGDKVKIRVDMSTNYPSIENNFTITSIERGAATPFKLDKKGNNVGGFIRPENPTGFLYELNKKGGSWEGKDLELQIQ